MLTTKRVVIATICGFIFGLVCMYLASSNPKATESLSTAMKWTIILSRTLMGFTLGISALRLAWWLHAVVIGIITSLPMAAPVVHDMNIAIGTVVLGIVYALLTELITTVLFKAKAAGRK